MTRSADFGGRPKTYTLETLSLGKYNARFIAFSVLQPATPAGVDFVGNPKNLTCNCTPVGTLQRASRDSHRVRCAQSCKSMHRIEAVKQRLFVHQKP